MLIEAALSPNAKTETSYNARQSALLGLICAALPAVLRKESLQADYLAYHRDWLIRTLALQTNQGLAKAAQVFASLDERLQTSQLPGSNFDSGLPPTAWQDSLADLMAYVSLLEDRREYELDPFASGCRFPILFRVLHTAARQFGIALLDEAFLYHGIRGGFGAHGGLTEFRLTPLCEAVPEPRIDLAADTRAVAVEAYPWCDLIRLSGGAGDAWVQSYMSTESELCGALPRALALLRRGHTSEGYELLEQVREYREKLRLHDTGLFHAVSNTYHAALAYYKYVTGDLAGAGCEMDESAAAIRRAIELHRFLLPLAPMLVNVPLQKARIARRERDWPAMARHLTDLYRMEVELSPLCVLSDRTEIDYGALRRYFAELNLPETGSQSAAVILDERIRLQRFHSITSKLYALADVAVIEAPLFN